MKTILLSIILSILITSFSFATKFNIPANIDSIMLAKMNQYNFPGLQACIVKDDSIIWKGAYGHANIDSNRMVTDSTLFIIQSVSKTITATALMQLWEEGLFGLNDDINGYLPSYFQVRNPNHPNDSITFRMLLTHTSSINDNWSVYNPLITHGSDSPIALDSFLVNYLVNGGTYYYSTNYNTFTPGAQWDYCNVGAGLIGYLVERISNETFEQYCQDSIFVPLGMNETSWFFTNLNINNIAMPYTYSNGNYIPYGHYGHPNYPDGQVRTSAIQLSHFVSAFIQKGQFNGITILNNSTVDSMTTVQFPSIDPTQGLIWFLNPGNIPNVGNRTICMHRGGWSGGSAVAGYILGTGENIGTVVLANRRHDDGIIDIGAQLLSYGIITDIEKDINIAPKYIYLSQNYPNPFNPSTTIEFTLPKTEYVELKIYNILGKEVTTLVSNKLNQGNHIYTFDGTNLASGVYYYQLMAGDYRQVKKMILLK